MGLRTSVVGFGEGGERGRHEQLAGIVFFFVSVSLGHTWYSFSRTFMRISDSTFEPL